MDLYHVLQVDPAAEPEVIEAAYRRLAAKYHPDVNKSAEAVSRMQDINAAHAVLSDPATRRQYDDLRVSPHGTEEHSDASGQPTTNAQASQQEEQTDESVARHNKYWRNRRQREANEKQATANYQAATRAPKEDAGEASGKAAEDSTSAKPIEAKSDSGSSLWLWLVPSLVIIGLLVWYGLDAANPDTSRPTAFPTAAWTAGPPSHARPVFEADITTTIDTINRGETPSLLDLVAGTVQPALREPGVQNYSVVLTGQKEIFLSEGWCAKDRTTLQVNMAHFSYSVVVNGYDIPKSQIHAMEYEVAKGEDPQFPEGMVCSVHGVLTSQWPIGENRVLEIHYFDAEINDGYDTYEPGGYGINYIVTVPSSNAPATAVPTVTPSRPTASNCYMTSDDKHSVRTSEFGTKQAAYLNADVTNIRPDTKVRVDWYALNVTGISSRTPIRSVAYKGADLNIDASGSGTIFFSVSPTGKGWPWGRYRVELWVDGAKACEQLFSVK